MMNEGAHQAGSLRCRDTTYLVSAGRDGALDEVQLQALALHLQGCERCRVAKRQFTRMFAALDDLLARPAGPEA
ncbi:MAG: zf-HC2 domain-containing protein [Pseudomonadota bacterium]|nr:zf-HC2 domain-containing protein [Pseudomonadota bacterium]